MLIVNWNNIKLNVTQIGGGVLTYDISRHSHSKKSYELHYIISGEGTLETDNGIYNLKAGDFFLTGPSFYHAQKPNENNPMRDIFFMLQVLDKKEANDVAEAFLTNDFYYCEGYNSTLANMIFKENEEKRLNFQQAISGLMCVELTNIARLLLPDDFYMPYSLASLNDRRFVIIENELLNNKSITLSSLAEKLGICERQLQRLLLKYYDKTFRQLKRELSENR